MCEPRCIAGTTRKVSIPAVLGDDSEGSSFGPKNGLYFNTIVEYEANGAVYIYSGDGIYTRIKDGKSEETD